MTTALEVYGDDLLTARDGRPATTWLRYEDGTVQVLDLPRWTAPVAGADLELLERCDGPTLDIGCGPGRLTRALVSRGLDCLGVDVAPVAVAMARVGGTPVLHASVFDEVLDDTRWGSILLADGNIGIGGDPARLLTRCRELLLPGGHVLVELDPPAFPTVTVTVRLESSSGASSDRFPWAHVAAGALGDAADRAGLRLDDEWSASGRWFADLHLAA